MNKTLSFLKIILKDNFSFKKKPGKKQISSITMLLLIAVVMLFYVFTYTNIGVEVLTPMGIQRFIPAVAYILVFITTVMMSFTKTKNILFNSKDNELAFSLPLTKNQIFLARMINVAVLNYLFSILIFLACSIFYGISQSMQVSYYLMAVILTIFLPLLPTAISIIIAYIIAYITNKFKTSKMIEIVFNFIIFGAIMILVYSTNSILNVILQNVEKVQNFLNGIGYFIKSMHMALIHMDVKQLFVFILINILSFVIITLLFGGGYKKIILSSKSATFKGKHKNKNVEYSSNTKLTSLIKKEFKTYTSSVIYVVNTLFGVVMLAGLTLYTVFIDNSMIQQLINSESDTDFIFSISCLLLILLSFILTMSNTACSSISIEGKKFWILKTIPVKIADVLKSKIMLNMLVIVPVTLICIALLCISFNISAIEMILLCVFATLLTYSCTIFGLIINLRTPKLDWQNETQVVKQSTSSFISMFIPMLIMMFVSIFLFGFSSVIGSTLSLVAIDFVLLIVSIIEHLIIYSWGPRRFREIE